VTSKIDATELYADEIAEAQSLPVIIPPYAPSSMPEEFAKTTSLALRAAQDILAMKIDEQDPNFRAKLSAKAAVASQQITAQLKADDQRLKATHTAEGSFYAELRQALEAYQAERMDKDNG